MYVEIVTAEERKRQHYIQELIDTEENYVADMSIVLEVGDDFRIQLHRFLSQSNFTNFFTQTIFTDFFHNPSSQIFFTASTTNFRTTIRYIYYSLFFIS